MLQNQHQAPLLLLAEAPTRISRAKLQLGPAEESSCELRRREANDEQEQEEEEEAEADEEPEDEEEDQSSKLDLRQRARLLQSKLCPHSIQDDELPPPAPVDEQPEPNSDSDSDSDSPPPTPPPRISSLAQSRSQAATAQAEGRNPTSNKEEEEEAEDWARASPVAPSGGSERSCRWKLKARAAEVARHPNRRQHHRQQLQSSPASSCSSYSANSFGSSSADDSINCRSQSSLPAPITRALRDQLSRQQQLELRNDSKLAELLVAIDNQPASRQPLISCKPTRSTQDDQQVRPRASCLAQVEPAARQTQQQLQQQQQLAASPHTLQISADSVQLFVVDDGDEAKEPEAAQNKMVPSQADVQVTYLNGRVSPSVVGNKSELSGGPKCRPAPNEDVRDWTTGTTSSSNNDNLAPGCRQTTSQLQQQQRDAAAAATAIELDHLRRSPIAERNSFEVDGRGQGGEEPELRPEQAATCGSGPAAVWPASGCARPKQCSAVSEKVAARCIERALKAQTQQSTRLPTLRELQERIQLGRARLAARVLQVQGGNAQQQQVSGGQPGDKLASNSPTTAVQCCRRWPVEHEVGGEKKESTELLLHDQVADKYRPPRPERRERASGREEAEAEDTTDDGRAKSLKGRGSPVDIDIEHDYQRGFATPPAAGHHQREKPTRHRAEVVNKNNNKSNDDYDSEKDEVNRDTSGVAREQYCPSFASSLLSIDRNRSDHYLSNNSGQQHCFNWAIDGQQQQQATSKSSSENNKYDQQASGQLEYGKLAEQPGEFNWWSSTHMVAALDVMTEQNITKNHEIKSSAPGNSWTRDQEQFQSSDGHMMVLPPHETSSHGSLNSSNNEQPTSASRIYHHHHIHSPEAQAKLSTSNSQQPIPTPRFQANYHNNTHLGDSTIAPSHSSSDLSQLGSRVHHQFGLMSPTPPASIMSENSSSSLSTVFMAEAATMSSSELIPKLIERLDRKLVVMKQEQLTLMREIELNETTGQRLFESMKRHLTPIEFDKISLHANEIEKVTKLILSLKLRLKRVETELHERGANLTDSSIAPSGAVDSSCVVASRQIGHQIERQNTNNNNLANSRPNQFSSQPPSSQLSRQSAASAPQTVDFRLPQDQQSVASVRGVSDPTSTFGLPKRSHQHHASLQSAMKPLECGPNGSPSMAGGQNVHEVANLSGLEADCGAAGSGSSSRTQLNSASNESIFNSSDSAIGSTITGHGGSATNIERAQATSGVSQSSLSSTRSSLGSCSDSAQRDQSTDESHKDKSDRRHHQALHLSSSISVTSSDSTGSSMPNSPPLLSPPSSRCKSTATVALAQANGSDRTVDVQNLMNQLQISSASAHSPGDGQQESGSDQVSAVSGAATEAAANCPPLHLLTDADILLAKRNKLVSQLDEAHQLEECIVRRNGIIVDRILKKYFDQTAANGEIAEFRRFTKFKSLLLKDSHDVADRIDNAELQLVELKRSQHYAD